jgi:hypothetical protein
MEGAHIVQQALNVASDGMAAGRMMPPPVADLTLELALFPFLFLRGKGCYRRGMQGTARMNDYMRHRMHQMFSPFTLFKVYLVHMWQLLQCNRLESSLPERTLLKYITKYKRAHPDATTTDAIKHVMKYCVPRTLEGSPMWYRTQLADLLAMVKKWGMPTQFLTLTAGDKQMGAVQWKEVSTPIALACAAVSLLNAISPTSILPARYLLHCKCCSLPA